MRFLFLFFSYFFILTSFSKDFEAPYFSGLIVDEAGLLSSAEKVRLNEILENLQSSKKMQVALLIPQSLQGYNIEQYTMEVAEKWKLGFKGEDNGLLIVVAPTERQMRIEVGYGLEGVIPDIKAKQMIEEIMVPSFKQIQYAQGINDVLFEIAQAVGVESGALQKPQYQKLSRSSRSSPSPISIIIFIIFILFSFLSSNFRGSRLRTRGRGWGSSGGFSRGGGFGGGFGGGGASGRW